MKKFLLAFAAATIFFSCGAILMAENSSAAIYPYYEWERTEFAKNKDAYRLTNDEIKEIEQKSAMKSVRLISVEFNRGYQNFRKTLEKEDNSYEDVIGSVEAFSTAAARAKSQYQIIKNANEKEQKYINEMIQNAEDIKKSSEKIISAVENENAKEYNQAIFQFKNTIKENNEIFERWNNEQKNKLGVRQFPAWIIFNIFTGLIFVASSVFYLIKRKQFAKVDEKLEKDGEFIKKRKMLKFAKVNILIGAGLLFIGSLIPLFQLIYFVSNNKGNKFSASVIFLIFAFIYLFAAKIVYVAYLIQIKKQISRNNSKEEIAKKSTKKKAEK